MSWKGDLSWELTPYGDEIIGGIESFAASHGLITSIPQSKNFTVHMTEPFHAMAKVKSVQITGHMENAQAGLLFIPSFEAVIPHGGDDGFGEIERLQLPIPPKYIMDKPIKEFVAHGNFNSELFQTTVQQAWDNTVRLARDTNVRTRTEPLPEGTREVLRHHGYLPPAEPAIAQK